MPGRVADDGHGDDQPDEPEANPSPCQAQTSWPEPTIKLGEIGARLGFALTEVFIRDTLRVPSCGTDKRAVLYKASDFARICAALINHLGRLA